MGSQATDRGTTTGMGKVLVVDDDAALRHMLHFFFELNGYQVLTAENGAEALSLADKERPDAIILDLVMPLMDGFEFLRLLRKNPATRDIPVIVVSVRDTEEDIARGWELGADFYLTKPFRLSELFSVVRNLTAAQPTPEQGSEPPSDS
jgi:two-component system phosphate regulon response regulator PhoB